MGKSEARTLYHQRAHIGPYGDEDYVQVLVARFCLGLSEPDWPYGPRFVMRLKGKVRVLKTDSEQRTVVHEMLEHEESELFTLDELLVAAGERGFDKPFWNMSVAEENATAIRFAQALFEDVLGRYKRRQAKAHKQLGFAGYRLLLSGTKGKVVEERLKAGWSLWTALEPYGMNIRNTDFRWFREVFGLVPEKLKHDAESKFFNDLWMPSATGNEQKEEA